MVLASSIPEVTVKDLLRVLPRAEQMMVHLQTLWKNACAAGLPGIEEAFTFPLSGSLLVFLFCKTSVSSTESTMFVEF